MNLRPYQQELINKIKLSVINGNKSVCAVLGCGGGKSIIEAMITKSANDKGNKVLFLVHRSKLCEQIRDTFEKCGVNFHLTQIGMVQTVTRRLAETEEPAIIITDECHHSLAKTYLNIYEYFPRAVRIGFTATPVRMGIGGLGKVFDDLIQSVSTKWLIENNYLAPYTYYSFKLIEREDLHVKRGDFVQSEVADLMEKPKIYGDTVQNYKRIADGRKTIVYCASIDASKATAQEFENYGYSAAHLDGTTPEKIREHTVNGFRDGKITILCNVDLFGEGFDVPDCECVILLRPTKSLTLHIQQSMRSMRYKPDKQAIIIDHVGNVFEHGLPDEVREWTLKERKKKTSNMIRVRECPKCFAVVSPMAAECPECGHEFEVTAKRGDIQVIDNINLEEISPEEIRLNKLRKKPHSYYQQLKTFDELCEFQEAKGYKFMWVLHKCYEMSIVIPSKYTHLMRRYVIDRNGLNEQYSAGTV